MIFACPQCGKLDAIKAEMVCTSRDHIIDGHRVIDEALGPRIVHKHCPCKSISREDQDMIKRTVVKKWWEDIALSLPRKTP